ncbi:MAG: hypothetical protein ACREXX_21685 [Gammaproteobacteria bacterium]
MTGPTKEELHTAIAAMVALSGSEYTGWRQRLRHLLRRREHTAKAKVYKELGYRQAGMVGENLAVVRPFKGQRKGQTVQLIGPAGITVEMLTRDSRGTRVVPFTLRCNTCTIKTDALVGSVTVEAATIEAAAVEFGRAKGLSGDNCREVLESVAEIEGTWMWIESDDAPDGAGAAASPSNPKMMKGTAARLL